VLMNKSHLGLGIAEEEGRMVGLITNGDIRRAIERWQAQFFDHTVGDIMTRQPKAVKPDTKLIDVQRIMQANKIHFVLVVNDDDKVLGVVDQNSCMI